MQLQSLLNLHCFTSSASLTLLPVLSSQSPSSLSCFPAECLAIWACPPSQHCLPRVITHSCRGLPCPASSLRWPLPPLGLHSSFLSYIHYVLAQGQCKHRKIQAVCWAQSSFDGQSLTVCMHGPNSLNYSSGFMYTQLDQKQETLNYFLTKIQSEVNIQARKHETKILWFDKVSNDWNPAPMTGNIKQPK